MEANLKIKKSKLSLKQALLILMNKKSFNKITIKELCNLANLNRSTFYDNYSDINELLLDIHTDVFESMSKVLRDSRKVLCENTCEENIRSLTKILNYIDANRDTFQLLLSNNEENMFEKNMMDYYMKLYVTDSASYMDRYIYMYHCVGSFSLVNQWLRDERPCSSNELARLIYAMSSSAREYEN